MEKASEEASPPGTPLVVPGYSLRPGTWRPGKFVAGTGKADITPPPGFPTGGDGPAGNLARGYWTRLYARAFFFADADGRTTVLVSLDTFAIPGGLSTSVARQVALNWNDQRPRMVITPDAILIAATHTHHGPGNFLTASTYNQFGSKFSGFSRPLFDFLVRQTTAAINKAIADARAHDTAVEMRVRVTRADGLQLNRAPSTFLLNPMSQTLMSSFHPPVAQCKPVVGRGEASKSGWDLAGCPRLRAADPTLTTVELKRGAATIGVLVFFAMHPTVLDTSSPVNSADFAGVTVSALEREWPQPEKPVVAFFNGAEGDIVARREQRDIREVTTVARLFQQHIRRALATETAAVASPAIAVARELVRASASCEATPHVKLAAAPIPGTAALGGGEDDRSQLFELGWRDGVRFLARNGQGPKLPALDSELLPQIQLTSVFGPPRVWPSELPLQFVRIGTLAFAAFPSELSTATGVMVRAQLSAPDRSPLVIVGLANEYANYVASPDEYGAQDYMAASTIWGPYQGTVFACRMRALANRTGPQQLSFASKTYLPGPSPEEIEPRMSFGPAAVGDERAAPEEELEKVLRLRNGAPARNLHFVEWQEEARDTDADFAAAGRRTVRIQVPQNGTWIARTVSNVGSVIDDDGGIGFVAVLRRSPAIAGAGRTARHWRAFWVAPLLEDLPAGGTYRFEVETRDAGGAPSYCHSEPFVLTATEGRPTTHSCAR